MSQAGRYDDGTINPDIETLTGDSGGAVGPTAGNIDIFSSTNTPGAGLTVVGTPGSSLLDVQLNELLVQTTDATQTTLWTITLDDLSAIVFDAFIVGVTDDFSTVLNGRINGSGRRAGGGAAAQNAIVDYQHNSVGAPLIAVNASGNNIRIRVVGEAGTTYNWRANVRYMVQS